MRILALMKYDMLAASTRQRLAQYIPYLEANGITVELSPLFGARHMERVARGERANFADTLTSYGRRLLTVLTRNDYDILWVHCEMFPYLPIEGLSRLVNKPIVFDYDDAIFHMYDAHKNRVVRRILGNKLAPLLSRVSACLCGNEYLQDYASRYCANTFIMPTVVDSDVWAPLPSAPVASGPPTVGWIGSPSTWLYVEPLIPSLLSATEKHHGRLRAIGGGPRSEDYAEVDAVPWSEDTEIAEVQRMTIGIMPVPDTPWTRGKCGYKLIQYMACGVPVVASPVGVNKDIVRDGVDGFLATNDHEWQEAVARLLGGPALRRAMGAAGRQRVVEHYSLRSQSQRLVEILRLAALGPVDVKNEISSIARPSPPV